MKQYRMCILLLTALLALFAAGCKKKVAVQPPPPPPKAEVPPPPKAPVIAEFTAEPGSIVKGKSSTLRWRTTDATDVTVSQGVGAVSPSGRREVYPAATTTYTLTAKGPGGSTTASATVNVENPPAPPIAIAAPSKTLRERIETDLTDAYFDYDKSDIREDARAILTKDADALKAILRDFPNASIMMEGHCDERGSAEYNLGLGDRRANSAKDFINTLGFTQLKTVSYGKERPQCTDSNETCWQKNRRVHFSAGEK